MRGMDNGASIDRPSNLRRHYVLVVMLIIYSINFIDRTIINVLVQPIKLELGLSDAQMGLLSGFAFALLYGTMGLPFAWVADRYSRVNLITITLAFWSVMTAVCGLAHNFLHMFLARIGVGIGEAACTPSAQSIISDLYSKERRSTALAVYSMGSPLGTLFGALCGGWIGQTLGWRYAFLVVGLPGVIVALFLWLTVKEPRRGGFDSGKIVGDAPPLGAALKKLWTLPTFRHLACGFALVSLSGYSLISFLVAFAQRQFDVTLMQASTAFGIIYGGTGAIGILAGGFIADWAGRQDPRMYGWIPAAGLCVAGPLLMLALTQNDPKMMMLISIPAAVLYPIYMGPGYATAHNIVEPRMRAMATVILLMFSSLIGLGIGPAATGAISDMGARHFFQGDFDASCRFGAHASPLCRAAEGHGLMIALMVAASIFIWAGLHFFLAGNKIKADFAKLH